MKCSATPPGRRSRAMRSHALPSPVPGPIRRAGYRSWKRRVLAIVLITLFLAAVASAQVGPPAGGGAGAGSEEAVLLNPTWSPREGFACVVNGSVGHIYELQVSEDLALWATLSQFTLTEPSQRITAPAAANFERMFYRLVGPVTEPSAAISDLSPPSASPGMPVRARAREPVFDEEGRVRIQVAGANVTTRWIGSMDELEFLTPDLPPGEYPVRLCQPGKLPGPETPFRVLPVRTQLLLFSLNADGAGGIRLLGRQEVGGNRTRSASPDQPRLSLDLLNEEGGLVATASVPHPAEGHFEVFDEGEKGEAVMHHGLPPLAEHFSVKLPNLAGTFRVRIYEAMAGMDLRSREGRAKRRFLEEIVVTQ